MAKSKLTIEKRAERYRTNHHELAKLQAAKDAKLSSLSATYDAKIRPLVDELFEDQTAITEHVKTYRDRMFPDGVKSTTWQSLGLQYKKGGKSVKIAEGFEEEDVISYLQERDEYENLVATKISIDKAAVKKAELSEKELEEIGLQIVQTETLTIKI